LTEDQIISGCIENSRKAQKALFDIYYLEMVVLCKYYCKDDDDAKWVVNQGFMDVFKNIQNFRRKSSLKTWMKRIMMNRAINYYNKDIQLHNRQVNMDYEQLANISTQSVDLNILGKLQADDIVALIRSLPWKERSVFTMFEMEGYTHKEISEALSMNENTCRWHLSNARKMLVLKLKKLEGSYYEKVK